MKKIALLVIMTGLLTTFTQAQYAKLYPTNWWTGMKWNKVQILVQGEYDGFNKEQVRLQYPGVKLLKTTALDNGKYLAIDLEISATAKAGDVVIEFLSGGKGHAVKWPLYNKRAGRGTVFAKGVNSSDLVY